MPNIVMYGPRGGSAFRCYWMLAELGLPHETKLTDTFTTGDHKKPEYLAINPTGQVPAMTYDDFALTESVAITHYLAEKHRPELFGATPEIRATGFRWELYILLNIQHSLATFAYKVWKMPVTAEMETKATADLARFLPILETWLSTHPYLAGEELTVSDIAARPSFNYAAIGGFSLEAYPSIIAWMKRCEERPSFVAALDKKE